MKYRLLQDIKMPSYVAKAGALFEEGDGTIYPVSQDKDNYLSGIPVKDIVGFDEWFEPVEEEWKPWRANGNETYWYVDGTHGVSHEVCDFGDGADSYCYESGNYFKTGQEAKDCIKFIKAQEIIRRDAKGFKPDWVNEDSVKYCGVWNYKINAVEMHVVYRSCAPVIYFDSRKSIEESFKKHPEEWRTYLTYEK